MARIAWLLPIYRAGISSKRYVRRISGLSTEQGSHVKLRYEHPDSGDVRIVTVPLTDADRISTDTYRSIAEQCGADDFDAWVDWIERNC